MRGQIDMEQIGCVSIIHDHDRDLWETMVGWVVVPDSDWGGFRRRRVIDISSLCARYMTEGQYWIIAVVHCAIFDVDGEMSLVFKWTNIYHKMLSFLVSY